MVPILLVAATLRLFGNDWDRYEHYHPDERYIAWVGTSLSFPTSFAGALNPQESTLNPYYWPPTENEEACILNVSDQPREFAYGHLPLYLTFLATELVERIAPNTFDSYPPTCRTADGSQVFTNIDKITVVGRALTALFDVGTVLAVFLLGRKLFGNIEGVLAALLLALTVTHIQLAHFLAVDPYMTFFVVSAIYLMIRALQAERPGLMLGLAAFCVGLAIGSKFSGILLGLPLFLTWFWARALSLVKLRRGGRMFLSLIGTMLTVLLAFALTNPFALLDMSCEALSVPVSFGRIQVPSFNWRSCFLFNIGKQAAMVNGDDAFPFVRQYFGTTPFIYFLEMQLRWGMGWLAGGLGILGSLWIFIRSTWRLNWRNLFNSSKYFVRPSARPFWLVLAWCVPFTISTGTFFVKFMRYWQPLIPFMLIFGIGFLWTWRRIWLRNLVAISTLTMTALYAVAFMSIYLQPHPWVIASLWVYDNIDPDSSILNEKWGDRLPSTLLVDGVQLSARSYRYQHDTLTWLSGIGTADNEEKWVDNMHRLADADYIIIESNRIYGVVPRLPALYPLSGLVFQPLFDGDLGYEAVYVTGRVPKIGNVHFKPDLFSWPGLTPPAAVRAWLDAHPGLTIGRADESFMLYDQSLVMIFENTGQFSAEKISRILTNQ